MFATAVLRLFRVHGNWAVFKRGKVLFATAGITTQKPFRQGKAWREPHCGAWIRSVEARKLLLRNPCPAPVHFQIFGNLRYLSVLHCLRQRVLRETAVAKVQFRVFSSVSTVIGQIVFGGRNTLAFYYHKASNAFWNDTYKILLRSPEGR